MPESGALFKVHLPNTACMEWFPEETGGKIGTVAYHAEQELDTRLYQDTGMYREKQFATADSVILQTMEEEIPILWDQELRYRPGFSSEGNVRMPVFLAKFPASRTATRRSIGKRSSVSSPRTHRSSGRFPKCQMIQPDARRSPSPLF